MKLLIGLGFSELNTRPRQSLVTNLDSCTGCRSCETICSMIKTGRIHPEMARLKVDRDPFEGRFSPHVCHQCSIPYCLNACPEGAIGISPKNGAVLINPKKCVGCGSCADACPFDMIVFDPEQKRSFKCNLCGGDPFCVKVCPTHALGLAFFSMRI